MNLKLKKEIENQINSSGQKLLYSRSGIRTTVRTNLSHQKLVEALSTGLQASVQKFLVQLCYNQLFAY